MKSNQNSLPLAKALDGFVAGEPAYFCIPGHRLNNGVSAELTGRFGENIFKYDLTEAKGLDDLHHPREAIKEAEALAADLYKAKHTRFLVNGTTCGNEALIMAVSAKGDEVIVARDVHKSVISGLVISGATPVWAVPDIDNEFGISCGISPSEIEKAIIAHPRAKAVFIVSPTYYGVLSDVEKIAAICHKHNLPLIVDEAHGSHLYFNENFPKGALLSGADAVVMSAHKTLASMTQSSFLHLNSERIDISRVDAALKITMSSSPSYILMTALDAVRHQMAQQGISIMQNAFELSLRLRRGLSQLRGIRLYKGCDATQILNSKTDISRIVFSAVDAGISGYELADLLFDKYKIALELSDKLSCVAVVTGANTANDIDRLIEALNDVVSKGSAVKSNTAASIGIKYLVPKAAMTPREAFFAQSEAIAFNNAKGRISAESIEPYPPGIPILNPGEVIDERVLEIIEFYGAEFLGCRKIKCVI